MLKKTFFEIIKIFPQKLWNLEQIKNYLRVSHQYDDELIKEIVSTAIGAAEHFIGLGLIKKDIRLVSNINGIKNFYLKYHPVIKVTNITLKCGREEKKIEKENYYLDSNILHLKNSLVNEELIVEYLTGIEEENFPSPLKQGILRHIAEMYDREECQTIGLSPEIKNLYSPYRQWKL